MVVPRDPTLKPVSFADYTGMKEGTFVDHHKQYESRRKNKLKRKGGPKMCAFCKQPLPKETEEAKETKVEDEAKQEKSDDNDSSIPCPRRKRPSVLGKSKSEPTQSNLTPTNTIDTFFSRIWTKDSD